MNYRPLFFLLGMPLFLSAALLTGCRARGPRPPRGEPPDRIMLVEATGYCACGKCCNWRRNWRFQPVIASGPRKGERKEVGITASGTRVRYGTIAADTDVLPFGAILYVPGYGYGRVEDRGGAIRGKRIDLFFPTHSRALEWGRQTVNIKVWDP